MPRQAAKVPAYCLHKASKQAVVRIRGKDHYLGPYGSPESHERYEQLIAHWRLHESVDVHVRGGTVSSNPDLSINELLLAFWEHATAYYPRKELSCLRDALKPLKTLHGCTPVRLFGPRALKTVRGYMIHEKLLARTVINQRISRIKRVFKWAVAEELIPAAIYHSLQALEGLRRGRTQARETDPVEPVADQHVDALLPFVSPPVAAMIQLQRVTGMRPGEVVLLRRCDIDQTADVWIYEPQKHKGQWRGQRKRIPLGPRAQAIIGAYLDRGTEDFVFSPQEAEQWRRDHRPPYQGYSRKTPVFPSEIRHREKMKELRRARASKRPKRESYDTDSYRARSPTGSSGRPGRASTFHIGIRINFATRGARRYVSSMVSKPRRSSWDTAAPM